MNTLRNTKDLADDRAMSITFDINTQQEATYDINKDQIGLFFNSAIKYTEESLKIYFME